MKQQINELNLKPEDLEPKEDDKEYDPKNDEVPKNKGGRPKVTFQEAGHRAKKMKIQPGLDHVVEWAQEHNVTVPQALGEFGQQYANQEANRAQANIFKDIADGKDPYAHQKMSVEEATALKVGLNVTNFQCLNSEQSSCEATKYVHFLNIILTKIEISKIQNMYNFGRSIQCPYYKHSFSTVCQNKKSTLKNGFTKFMLKN